MPVPNLTQATILVRLELQGNGDRWRDRGLMLVVRNAGPPTARSVGVVGTGRIRPANASADLAPGEEVSLRTVDISSDSELVDVADASEGEILISWTDDDGPGHLCFAVRDPWRSR